MFQEKLKKLQDKAKELGFSDEEIKDKDEAKLEEMINKKEIETTPDEPKTKYKIKYPKDWETKKRPFSFVIGSVKQSGDVVELTDTEVLQYGEQYFEKVK